MQLCHLKFDAVIDEIENVLEDTLQSIVTVIFNYHHSLIIMFSVWNSDGTGQRFIS